MREVASQAGLDKNTVLRLEAGLPVRSASRQRICEVYGVLNVNPEAEPSRVVGAHWAHSLPEALKWHRARLIDPQLPSEISSSETYQDERERRRQGTWGLANQFFARLDCDMPSGRLRSGIFEVYGSSGLSRQQSGEALVYIIQGALRLVVGDDEFIVAQGCAATFDRTILHLHEPAPGLRPEDLPVVMLYVQTD